MSTTVLIQEVLMPKSYNAEYEPRLYTKNGVKGCSHRVFFMDDLLLGDFLTTHIDNDSDGPFVPSWSLIREILEDVWLDAMAEGCKVMSGEYFGDMTVSDYKSLIKVLKQLEAEQSRGAIYTMSIG